MDGAADRKRPETSAQDRQRQKNVEEEEEFRKAGDGNQEPEVGKEDEEEVRSRFLVCGGGLGMTTPGELNLAGLINDPTGNARCLNIERALTTYCLTRRPYMVVTQVIRSVLQAQSRRIRASALNLTPFRIRFFGLANGQLLTANCCEVLL